MAALLTELALEQALVAALERDQTVNTSTQLHDLAHPELGDLAER